MPLDAFKLIIFSVMALLLPVAFSTALKSDVIVDSTGATANYFSDEQRGLLLTNSRGLACILLTMSVPRRPGLTPF